MTSEQCQTNERRQKAESPGEDLSALWRAFFMVNEMGVRMGYHPRLQ